MFTFEDLEKAVAEAKSNGVSATDVVAFLNTESNTIHLVKETKAEPQTSVEGSPTSVGGTFWLMGTEY